MGDKLDYSAILRECDDRKALREKIMPTEKDALSVLFEAYQRLRELGWNDAIYCPKNGSVFSAIEAGSTGVHECTYTGEWPDGSWWIHDGDMWPARPILWRKRREDDPVVRLGLAMSMGSGHD